MTKRLPPKQVRPTDVELQVLDVFWTNGPSTVREIHNLITQTALRRKTSYSTTLKMIQVLHEKGFLIRDETVRPQIYEASVSRESTQTHVLQDLAQRLFGGAMSDLVQCAVSSSASSSDEIALMQSAIREAKKRDSANKRKKS